ncbi:hypothetical protein A7U60_g3188 [Sanghuangporus baumii]|uniref:Uncharacterized protein n=1 Tax=Sanghuangporus baumii TaxID=108892 RepID=A0A9Q5I0T1_SANBA|nr:hypothetical protein A7U60_g3188 [Sanghuangporus baumii]
MGTCGAVIYVHNGTYFIMFRSSGGDLSSLGKEVVDEIPPDQVAFETWLQNKRAFFDAEERRMDQLRRKYEAEGQDEEERFYEPYVDKPDCIPYEYRCYEYEYTVNLDVLTFLVGQGAFFSLRDIPRGTDGDLWRHLLARDFSLDWIFRPDAPNRYRKFPRDNSPPPIQMDHGLRLYQRLRHRIKIIDEFTWMSEKQVRDQTASHVLSSAITKALMSSHNGSLQTFRQGTLETERFHVKAELILRATSPAGFSLGECRRYYRYTSNLPDKILSFLDDIPVKFYEYRGCVIFLTQRCSSSERLRAHVGLAVEHARLTGRDKCTVIIFSINHVAVVVISDALSSHPEVSHSKLYPLLDSFYSEQFEKSLGLLAHYLRPHCIDGGVVVSGAGNMRSSKLLPWDILQQIMQSVDSETYDEFRLVCKGTRSYWYFHPRIDDFTINRVQSAHFTTFKHLPRIKLYATDRDGRARTLYFFKQTPCAYGDGEGDCGCEKCSKYKICCPCENLCFLKRCDRDLELRLPPAQDPKLRREVGIEDGFILWSKARHRSFFEDGKVFRTDLCLTDQKDSCRSCSRDNFASPCTQPCKERVCKEEIERRRG